MISQLCCDFVFQKWDSLCSEREIARGKSFLDSSGVVFTVIAKWFLVWDMVGSISSGITAISITRFDIHSCTSLGIFAIFFGAKVSLLNCKYVNTVNMAKHEKDHCKSVFKYGDDSMQWKFTYQTHTTRPGKLLDSLSFSDVLVAISPCEYFSLLFMTLYKYCSCFKFKFVERWWHKVRHLFQINLLPS